MRNANTLDYAITTQNLTKRYGRVEAVSELNLNVSRQYITGFLGRNGAGKSTTIRMLLGMTQPSAGSGTVLGRAITDANESREIRRHVAYVGEDKELYGYMTVGQLIRFTSSFYSDWRPETAQRLQRQYELPSKRKARDLSKGMRAKLALLLALSRRPELLVLDEPSDGLDPVAIEELLQTFVAASAEGTAVFFSSHQIAEVERIAERVCMIDHGKLVADLSLDEMRQDYRRITLGFATEPPRRDFEIQGVRHVQTSGRQLIFQTSRNADAVIEWARSMEAVSVDVTPVTLREVFLETVKEAQ
jgi:ABC-2 type transport system ATP-binding protein